MKIFRIITNKNETYVSIAENKEKAIAMAMRFFKCPRRSIFACTEDKRNITSKQS